MASEAAMASYDLMRSGDPLASVADVRDGCIAIVDAVVASYGAAAGLLAAEMYDELAAESSAEIPDAVVSDMDDATFEVIDRSVRFDVGVLASDREDI